MTHLEPATPAYGLAVDAPVPDADYQQFLAALLAGDRQRCHALFDAWLAEGTDLRFIYLNRIQRALYDIGSLWEQGRVQVATEHLASAICEGLLNLAMPRLLKRQSTGRSAVVSCSANEHHQIGARMVADFFELHGWRAHFLGANASDDDLLALIREKRPDVVALSLALYFNIDALLHSARAIRGEFPHLPIIVGGQAFLEGGGEAVKQIEGTHLITSIAGFEAWLEEAQHAH